MNDINVTGMSNLSMSYMELVATTTKYSVGDTKFEEAHFLAHGIYPDYAYSMKIISNPKNPKEKYFAKKQKGVGEDVKRAFGGLLIKWHFLNVAAISWFPGNLKKKWHACFILHNMTMRDNDDSGYDRDKEIKITCQQEREQARIWRDTSGITNGGRWVWENQMLP